MTSVRETTASSLRHAARRLVSACLERGLSFGAAESCTGGLASAVVTDLPGVSRAFAGAVVSYSNAVKHNVLGVPKDTLERFGTVSRETAIAMAEGARQTLGCDAAFSLTGIAGPGGAVPGKPVGTVWCATSAGNAPASAFLVPVRPESTRRQVRRASVLSALVALAEAVERLPSTGSAK